MFKCITVNLVILHKMDHLRMLW